MAPRTLALATATAALLAAGCGGEAETVTVTQTETETVTETVTPEGADDRAHALAQDVCRSVPHRLVAPFIGADPDDPADIAEAFGRLARPELREAATDGCRAGLDAP